VNNGNATRLLHHYIKLKIKKLVLSNVAVSRPHQPAIVTKFPHSENSGELAIFWRPEKTSNDELLTFD